ncbi:MAG TPA: hypothetical protein VK203_18215 [Nostocaceae cyanobacterium]|nr:hypothetical protein [Nostocaceae cyanobacterium]
MYISFLNRFFEKKVFCQEFRNNQGLFSIILQDILNNLTIFGFLSDRLDRVLIFGKI